MKYALDIPTSGEFADPFVPKPIQQPRIPVWVAAGWPSRKPLRRAARWDGTYLMGVHQETGRFLTPEDIREIAAYVHTRCQVNRPFDIAVNGETPSSPRMGAKLVRPYIEAGATWWVDFASEETLKAYRKRIRSGPPKI